MLCYSPEPPLIFLEAIWSIFIVIVPFLGWTERTILDPNVTFQWVFKGKSDIQQTSFWRKLICCSREFEFLILVVCVSNSTSNKTWFLFVSHVMCCLAHWTFSSTILKWARNKKHITGMYLNFKTLWLFSIMELYMAISWC